MNLRALLEAEDTSSNQIEQIYFEVDTCNGNVEAYLKPAKDESPLETHSVTHVQFKPLRSDATNMEIREINQTAKIPGERLSNLTNNLNHLTLDSEAKTYVLAKPDIFMKKDMEEICSYFKLRETHFMPMKNGIVEVSGIEVKINARTEISNITKALQ